MNTPVSFEIAKLLKEKGFDNIECNGYYHVNDGYTKGYAFCYSSVNSQEETAILTPTIADVVMWLHKEKGLWVNVMYMGFELKYSWSIDIITTSGSDWDSYGEEVDICYKSPTEAYSQAIIYTLKNLI